MTTTIATITQAPILPVWMLDAPLHTEANNFICDDPTCPCQEDAPVIVESTLVSEPSWLREQYRPIPSNDYYEPDEAAPVWQSVEEDEEIEDCIEDDDYPSEEQVDAMYSDCSGWSSDYL